MQDTPRQMPPEGKHRLDVQRAGRVTERPGVYAAWIPDDAALTNLGIDGAAPVLWYVGRATGTGGLRARLRRHARSAWWELVDLLASRRVVLPGWWWYADKNTAHRTLTIPPLAMVSHEETLRWQHSHLRWGWVAASKVNTRALEADLIATHLPLLNLHGRGLRGRPPVQLRKRLEFERDAAWWLFHVSWLAVITLRSDEWIEVRSRHTSRPVTCSVACDDDGWPVPLAEGRHHEITVPDEAAARKVLIKAAPRELRAVVAETGTGAHEATAWWAAYAGHPFLRDGTPHEDVLAAALRRNDEGYAGPGRLPTDTKLRSLLNLVALLPRVTH